MPDETEMVAVRIGMRPRSQLTEKAGITLDRGVKVDAYLETSVPGIFAAGASAETTASHETIANSDIGLVFQGFGRQVTIGNPSRKVLHVLRLAVR